MASRTATEMFQVDPGSENAGDACAQHLAGVVGGAQRPVLHAGVEVELLEREDVAVGDMAVGVDHARHDSVAGGIDCPVTAQGLGCGRDLPVGSNLADAVALHQHRDAVLGRRAGRVEQPPTSDQVSAHVTALPAHPHSPAPRPTGPASAEVGLDSPFALCTISDGMRQPNSRGDRA